jgi:molybdopterin-dependent oxidoreductase alpha subunit
MRAQRHEPPPSAAADGAAAPTTPVETGAPRVTAPSTQAGGVSAVIATTRYVLRESGVRRGLRTLAQVNQTSGFDCPSCAWPDPRDRGRIEFCENGAKAVADEATTKRVGPEFFARYTVTELLARPDQWLNAQGRLTHPVMLRDGADRYEPVSWDDAFAILGQELRGLAHPDEAAFYTSGRTSNEAAFLFQLFARAFGTNNLPDCSNMCHESSGRGLAASIGTGKGTVRLDDFDRADAIFIIGQNPGTNHPRMLTTLRAAKLRGATIVAVNPLREAGLLRFAHPQKVGDLFGGVPLADLYLQVRVGGDIPLFKAMMKLILAANAVDREFVAAHTDGFDALVADLERHELAALVAAAGVTEAEVRAAAAVAIRSRATICCWAMGITQHRHAVDNVKEIANFLMMRGMLGKPGAGACPVRGHSNVQGDRTMGICERPPAWTAKLGERFGFTPPAREGVDVVGAIEAMRAGKVRAFFALGGNFLSATPDTELTAAALRGCSLTAHVSTKLNRSHLVTGRRALVLPCHGRTERDPAGFVTVEDSMSCVHRSQGVLPPAADTILPEPAIVARLARATLGPGSPVDWEALAADYDRVRDVIAEIVPGFADFNARAREELGFTLPNSARDLDFRGVGGRAHFTVLPLPDLALAAGQLLLTTVRSHDQFNTTVYDVNDRYRGIHGHRRVVLVHADDMAERGIAAGDRVTITSHFRGETRSSPGWTVVAYDLPRRTAAAYFPEANVLVPVGHYAEISRTPASKSVAITIAKDPS